MSLLHKPPFEKKGAIISPRVTGDELDMEGAYLLQTQNIPDLAAKGAGYWFDGVDDCIYIDDNVNLRMGESDFSLIFAFQTGDEGTILSKGKYGVLGEFELTMTIATLDFKSRAADYIVFSSPLPSSPSRITVVGVVRYGDSGIVYIDSNKSVEEASVFNGLNLNDSLHSFDICTRDNHVSNFINTSVYRTLLFNLALSELEIKAFSSGAPVPYKYIGASQINQLTGDDHEFTVGLGNWLNSSGVHSRVDSEISPGTSSVTAGANDKWVLRYVSSAEAGYEYRANTLIIGKKYNVKALVYSDDDATYLAIGINPANIVSSQTIAEAGGSINTWTSLEVEGVALNDRIIFSGAANGKTFWVDHVEVTQIGCVLQLEQPGIGHNQWLDNSGNELHGEVSGALPTNLPADNIERFRHTVAITGDTTWTDVVPAGYAAEMLILKNTGTGACLLDLGSTSGAHDVFQNQAIAGKGAEDYSLTNITINKLFSETVAQSLYLNDDSTPGWTNVSLTATLLMKRVI